MIVPFTNFCAVGRILFGNFSSRLVCGKLVLAMVGSVKNPKVLQFFITG
jgi:hypothetical protein